jgi:hypothetical protein
MKKATLFGAVLLALALAASAQTTIDFTGLVRDSCTARSPGRVRQSQLDRARLRLSSIVDLHQRDH